MNNRRRTYASSEKTPVYISLNRSPGSSTTNTSTRIQLSKDGITWTPSCSLKLLNGNSTATAVTTSGVATMNVSGYGESLVAVIGNRINYTLLSNILNSNSFTTTFSCNRIAHNLGASPRLVTYKDSIYLIRNTGAMYLLNPDLSVTEVKSAIPNFGAYSFERGLITEFNNDLIYVGINEMDGKYYANLLNSGSYQLPSTTSDYSIDKLWKVKVNFTDTNEMKDCLGWTYSSSSKLYVCILDLELGVLGTLNLNLTYTNSHDYEFDTDKNGNNIIINTRTRVCRTAEFSYSVSSNSLSRVLTTISTLSITPYDEDGVDVCKYPIDKMTFICEGTIYISDDLLIYKIDDYITPKLTNGLSSLSYGTGSSFQDYFKIFKIYI